MCEWVLFRLAKQAWFVQETFFMKWMPKFHTLVMQVSKNTYLFVASWEIKYDTYIVNWRL